VRALLRVAALGAIVLAILAASAGPVFGDDTGTVQATVTAATPCLLIQGSTSINFGTATFSTAGPQFGNALAKPVGTSTLANCTAAAELLFARATDATGSGNAAWSLQPNLDNPCTAGTDKFSVMSGDGSFNQFLSTTNGEFASISAAGTLGDTKPIGFSMFMPCSGSSGAGQTMSFAYIYTATF
jgi:hypothetical protein